MNPKDKFQQIEKTVTGMPEEFNRSRCTTLQLFMSLFGLINSRVL
ncbi:hypothetical protein [Leptospira interrogans]|nr:hypothetical protein [Leptospira interrogans]